MSVTTALAALQAAHTDISAAITSKGGTVNTGDGFSDFATGIGTITSGTPSVPRKDVNFYDYDGTRLFAYTLAEAAALAALPTQPTHTGLTGQGWNYTLAQVNALTRKCDVGAMCITDDGKTRLYIHVESAARATVPLYWSQTVANGVTIDWGDSATETDAGTGNLNKTHDFSAGDYVIALDPAVGCALGLGNDSNTTTVIGGSAVGYKNMLRKVEIGARITNLGSYVFSGCYSLASVAIPSDVTSIGDYAFQECFALASVVIPIDVTIIKSNIVASCYSLSMITIPDNVTEIGVQAFYKCHSLASVAIPDTATSITSSPFRTCYSLASVVLPYGVTTIGATAFQNCYSLASVVIPGSVTSIEATAFQNCYSLASVVIPASVASIAGTAFQNNAFTKEYHLLRATPPTLANTDAFTGIAADCIIYVPATSLAAYQAASKWITYAAKMVGE